MPFCAVVLLYSYCVLSTVNLCFNALFCVHITGNSNHPEIVTVLERKVDILPTAQPAHSSSAASVESSDTDPCSSKPFTALKDRFLQV